MWEKGREGRKVRRRESEGGKEGEKRERGRMWAQGYNYTM